MKHKRKEPSIHELFDLTGRAALITGASGWLGSSLSHALAEAGATVVCASRRLESAQEAAAKLPTPGGVQHLAVRLDHMDEQSLHAGFCAAVEAAGRLDILVNNGLDSCAKDLTNVRFEEFARHQVNNAGYFELARCMRDHAVARQAPASIVLIGSMYGVVGSYPEAYEGVYHASPVAYHVLKGGTIHMAHHLAVYYARDRVRVNCLSPGPFPKDGGIPDEMRRRLCDKAPTRRMGRPYELKGALLLLASDAGSYITGHNLIVDGGWTAW